MRKLINQNHDYQMPDWSLLKNFCELQKSRNYRDDYRAALSTQNTSKETEKEMPNITHKNANFSLDFMLRITSGQSLCPLCNVQGYSHKHRPGTLLM